MARLGLDGNGRDWHGPEGQGKARIFFMTDSVSGVVLAFDRDGKSQTAKAQNNLGRVLTGMGHRVLVASWSGVKGIDDAVCVGVEIDLKEWAEVRREETKLDQPQHLLHQPVPVKPLADWEIIGYVKEHGPLPRTEIPLRHPQNQSVLVSNWIRQGKLKIVGKGAKGQILTAVGE